MSKTAVFRNDRPWVFEPVVFVKKFDQNFMGLGTEFFQISELIVRIWAQLPTRGRAMKSRSGSWPFIKQIWRAVASDWNNGKMGKFPLLSDAGYSHIGWLKRGRIIRLIAKTR